MVEAAAAHLIDVSARNTLYNRLSLCHATRVQLYSTVLNVAVLLLLVLGVALTLYCCYQRQPSEYEKRQQMLRDQDYILSKIRHSQAQRQNLMLSPLGNIPVS
jgi:uncharacterized protein HemX